MFLCCLCMNDFLSLGLLRELVFIGVSFMESDKQVIGVVEDRFLHETGWGWFIVEVV